MAGELKNRVVYDVALGALALLLIGVGIYFLRAPRVGVINTERLAQVTGVTDRIREGEKRVMGSTFSQLNEMTERVRAQVSALETQLDKTSDDAAKKVLQEKIRRVQMEAQAVAERSRQDFQQYRDAVRRQFRATLDPIVTKVARSHHYDVVIDAGDGRAVPYVRASVDITDEVIKEARSVLAASDLGLAGNKASDTASMPDTGVSPEPVGEKKK